MLFNDIWISKNIKYISEDTEVLNLARWSRTCGNKFTKYFISRIFTYRSLNMFYYGNFNILRSMV